MGHPILKLLGVVLDFSDDFGMKFVQLRHEVLLVACQFSVDFLSNIIKHLLDTCSIITSLSSKLSSLIIEYDFSNHVFSLVNALGFL